MADLRTLAAAALGIGLGLAMLVRPGVVVAVHTAGRLPHDRGGRYGETAASDRTRLLVRIVGVALVGVGGWIGAGTPGL
jgi:hypothetical protein